VRAALFAVSLAFALPLAAQQPTVARAPVPEPVTNQSSFRRLELPEPTLYRTGSGAPGSRYWQQRVDYVIRATLDTARKILTGEERITYTNNSPDTLRYLWLQLDQNLFRADSRGSLIVPPDSRFGTGGAEGGVTIGGVSQPALPAGPGRPAQRAGELATTMNQTMMRVDLPRPLPPGQKTVFDVEWYFPFLQEINTRMGITRVNEDFIYEVAQWYPRLAVYDDVRGWNTEQYMGNGEFYLEYGRFDVSLTVPASMIVAATGILQNPTIVLTADQRARLAQARASDSTVIIRGKNEVNDPATRPASRTGTHTWRFVADSVRDFAWAAANHFVWDAARANGGKVLVMSLYPPAADTTWNQATQYGKAAIERYSEQWWPYPYPIAININGREGGMEYPMIVFCNRDGAQALYSVTDHEFGHMWFPMLVGNNERLYPWMDEGFNTFMNYYNWEKQYPGTFNRRANVDAQIQFALSGNEQPIITSADQTNPVALGSVAYNKPGLGLRLLRDQILGPERFDPAFKEFIRRWQYRHPTPADFFRTMEDGVGEDLSWFWRSYFYTTETMDIAVDSVRTPDNTGRPLSLIYLRKVGPMPVPVIVDLLMDDGFNKRIKLPVEVWYYGDTYVASIPGPARVTSVKIDPDKAFPEVRRDNNNWPRSPVEGPRP
jgi:Peptidase family M1 domain